MVFYTKSKVSPAGKVNERDLRGWGRNLLIFLAPLGIIYLLQLNTILQSGLLTWGSLIPTPTTIGAIQLYCVNGLLDLLRKFSDSSR